MKANTSYSHGTLNPVHLIPTLVELLDKEDADDGELLSTLVNDLCDRLDDLVPPYCYFGSHPGDGSDFGCWVSEDWREQAEDDGTLIVNDGSEVPDDHDGLWIHINDHGNVALYARVLGEDKEVWSLV